MLRGGREGGACACACACGGAEKTARLLITAMVRRRVKAFEEVQEFSPSSLSSSTPLPCHPGAWSGGEIEMWDSSAAIWGWGAEVAAGVAAGVGEGGAA